MHLHMLFVMSSILIAGVGQIWLAWDIYEREGLLWSLLIFLIPFPLLALYAWYRAKWTKGYVPALVFYSLGYLLVYVSGAYKMFR